MSVVPKGGLRSISARVFKDRIKHENNFWFFVNLDIGRLLNMPNHYSCCFEEQVILRSLILLRYFFLSLAK